MHQSNKFFFICSFLVFVLIFSQYSKSVTAQEVENEGDFNYITNGTRGPEHWGDLKEEWAKCKTGRMQSPIALSGDRLQIVFNSEPLKTRYKPSNATVKNRGHDISVQWANNSAGSIEINGTEYFIQMAHWHSPSEHTINGRRFALELHMVHYSLNSNATYNTSVVAYLYDFGPPDRFLRKLSPFLRSFNDTLAQRDIGVVDPNDIRSGGRNFYRYMGSLTTPPCTEGVIWTVFKEITTVSREQVRELQNAVFDDAEMNARPLQPRNGRPVQLFIPRLRNTPN